MKALTFSRQPWCKFVDDTYLVILASNVDSRATEIDNIETWARTNNLTLNRNKSKEIVFSDPKRRRQIESPPPVTDIARVTSRLSKLSASQMACRRLTMSVTSSDHARASGPVCARHVSRGAAGHLFRSVAIANSHRLQITRVDHIRRRSDTGALDNAIAVMDFSVDA